MPNIKLKNPNHPIPEEVIDIADNEKTTISFYLDEWKTVINTQMHFNDLIIRFRSLTLTAFTALLGAGYAGVYKFELSRWFLLLPLSFWIGAFILDFFYYHRLLLGSVAHAKKFDNSIFAQKLGLFGLTECIKNHVQPPTSKWLVVIFYLSLLFGFLPLFWLKW